MTPSPNSSLDPENWDELRAHGHRMLEDMFDHIASVRDRPVWRQIPESARRKMREGIPRGPSDLADVYAKFEENVAPFTAGNIHPAFMGWVHGGGTAVGMLADMLAAGLNANLGGRDHMPIAVEQQVVDWMRELFGFPDTATGLFVTGTSMANFIALLVARTSALGSNVREDGICASSRKLRAYTSTAAHGCIAKAFDMAGFGSKSLRIIPTNALRQINVAALADVVAQDRRDGLEPFLVVGTAGSVDTGAIDDLAALADLCAREKLAFHVDGAYGALGMMSAVIAPKLRGIERADSVAFDFHKWAQVPYDAGFVLVRDGDRHHATFSTSARYLQRASRGIAAGSFWPCDYGPDLSRGFRALKTWFTLQTYGTDRLGAIMTRTCQIAKYLEHRVESEPLLELLAPAQLNIVCFRVRHADPDRVNAAIVMSLHESGISAPSTTMIDGNIAIRAAIFNHRTEAADVDRLIDAVLRLAGD